MPLVKYITRFVLAFALLVCWHKPQAQKPVYRESQLKAVFLFNFTQFIEWPPGSFTSDTSRFVIGILGADPFQSFLRETISGEKNKNHPLVIEHYNSVEEIGACHILYVNISDKSVKEQVIKKLAAQPVLTVSDASDFMYRGGMIRFFTKQDKIKLQMNLEVAKAAHLSISSKLLSLAEFFVPQKE